ASLLDQLVRNAGRGDCGVAQQPRGLQRHADFVECDDVRPQTGYLSADQRMPVAPARANAAQDREWRHAAAEISRQIREYDITVQFSFRSLNPVLNRASLAAGSRAARLAGSV